MSVLFSDKLQGTFETMINFDLLFVKAITDRYFVIMRPSSLGGAAYCVALCLSVCLSVCPSVCLSVRPVIVAIGNVFSSTASVTDALFGTH